MRTPDSLNALVDHGIIDEVVRPLMSGKEAQVYLVLAAGEQRVAKIYKEAQNRTFQNRADYVEGRKVRNSRDQRAMGRGSRHGKAQNEAAWRSAEVDMIYRLRDAGVRVPAPYHFIDGVLIMELVTDAEGFPAPRLGDLVWEPEDATQLFQQLLGEVVRMLSIGVVHGDLSDFNVLMSGTGPVVIDFPQSVDASTNANARKLLLRDVDNLNRFAAKFAPGHAVLPYAEEMWELYKRNALTPDTRLTGRFRGAQKVASTTAVLDLIADANKDERRRRENLGMSLRGVDREADASGRSDPGANRGHDTVRGGAREPAPRDFDARPPRVAAQAPRDFDAQPSRGATQAPRDFDAQPSRGATQAPRDFDARPPRTASAAPRDGGVSAPRGGGEAPRDVHSRAERTERTRAPRDGETQPAHERAPAPRERGAAPRDLDARPARGERNAAPRDLDARPARGERNATPRDLDARPARGERGAAPRDLDARPADRGAAPRDRDARPARVERSQAPRDFDARRARDDRDAAPRDLAARLARVDRGLSPREGDARPSASDRRDAPRNFDARPPRGADAPRRELDRPAARDHAATDRHAARDPRASVGGERRPSSFGQRVAHRTEAEPQRGSGAHERAGSRDRTGPSDRNIRGGSFGGPQGARDGSADRARPSAERGYRDSTTERTRTTRGERDAPNAFADPGPAPRTDRERPSQADTRPDYKRRG